MEVRDNEYILIGYRYAIICHYIYPDVSLMKASQASYSLEKSIVSLLQIQNDTGKSYPIRKISRVTGIVG